MRPAASTASATPATSWEPGPSVTATCPGVGFGAGRRPTRSRKTGPPTPPSDATPPPGSGPSTAVAPGRVPASWPPGARPTRRPPPRLRPCGRAVAVRTPASSRNAGRPAPAGAAAQAKCRRRSATSGRWRPGTPCGPAAHAPQSAADGAGDDRHARPPGRFPRDGARPAVGPGLRPRQVGGLGGAARTGLVGGDVAGASSPSRPAERGGGGDPGAAARRGDRLAAVDGGRTPATRVRGTRHDGPGSGGSTRRVLPTRVTPSQ